MKKKLLLILFMLGFIFSVNAQWTEQASGFATASRGIRYICAVDTNVVWATAYDGSVQSAPEIQEFTRTTNGGALWQAHTITGYTGWGLAMIYAIDSMTAWIPVWNGTGGGAIIKTIDGGDTWTQVTTTEFAAPAGFPNVAHFWDANNGFAMGDPNGGYFEIYTTTDGGNTWTRVPQADIPNPISSAEYGTTGLYSVVGDIVWFTTGKGRVYKSIDRGYHWTVSATPNTTDQLNIDFKDANSGIVKSNQSPFNTYYTTNGGTIWQLLPFTGTLYTNDFCYVNGADSSWVSVGADITGGNAGISYSNDDGSTWSVFTGTDTAQFLKVAFPSNKIGYAGSFNTDAVTGGMWKYAGNDFPNTSFISENFEQSGLKVYPNPAHNILNVNTGWETGTIELLNSLGQCVYRMESTQSRNVIDVSDFKTGLYFLRISNSKGATIGTVSIVR